MNVEEKVNKAVIAYRVQFLLTRSGFNPRHVKWKVRDDAGRD